MSNSSFKIKNSLNIQPIAGASASSEGDLAYDSTGHKLHLHNGTTDSPVVTEDHTATLSNKTLVSPVIISPTLTVTDNTFTIQDNGDATKQVQLELSGLTASTTRTLTVPDASLTLVGTATTQTLTNKTLSGNTATNLISGSGTLTLNTSGTATVPNANDTLVGKATTDTLTNKTFDADGTGNSITNIENADIKAAAAIAVNKLAAVTASRALVSDGSGFVSAATTTATEIGYVNGVTSAIQTQLGTKTSYTANQYGVVLSGSGNTMAVLAPDASTTKVLTSGGLSANPTWSTASVGSVTSVALSTPNGLAVSGSPITTTGTLALTNRSVNAQSASYGILTTDYIITFDASGGSRTATLPTAVGASGTCYVIKKIDSSTNTVILATTSAQTIDGAASSALALATQYESITLCSDGANWLITDHRCTTNFIAYTPTFTGFGTATGISFQSRRIGDSLHVHGVFTTGTVTGVAAKISLGFNGTDSNVTINSSSINSPCVIGSAVFGNSAATLFGIWPLSNGANTFVQFGYQAATSAAVNVANASSFIGNSQLMSVDFTVPISGWFA